MDHFWSLINNSFFFPAMRLIHAFKLFCLFECAGLRECYAWGQTFCFFQRAGYLWRMEQAIRQPINVVCRMASTGKNSTDRASVLYAEYYIHNTPGPQMFNLRWEKLGCRFSRNSCQNMRVHAHCIPKQVVLAHVSVIAISAPSILWTIWSYLIETNCSRILMYMEKEYNYCSIAFWFHL